MNPEYFFQIGDYFKINIHIKVEYEICLIEIEGSFHDMKEGKEIFNNLLDCLEQIITHHTLQKCLLILKIYGGNTGTFAVTLFKLLRFLSIWIDLDQVEVQISFLVDINDLDMIECAEELEEVIRESDPQLNCAIIKLN